jgi:NTP pyrophosphatase (non-canonical NTP hydrolase)
MTSPLNEISMRAIRAQARYGDFASAHEALGVACEEWDELREAVHQNNRHQIASESMDLAAVLLRLAEHCLHDGHEAFDERSGF